MEKQTLNCQNCNETLKEDFEFCPQCGQKAKDELTVGVLFYNTISNYFSFDARFFRSFIPLMFKPGFVAREFVKGKRLQYLHPAQYYLFVTVVFFFIFNFKAREYNSKAEEAIKKGFEVEQKQELNVNPLDSVNTATITEAINKSEAIKVGMTEAEQKALDSIINSSGKVNFNGNMFGYNSKKLDSLIDSGASDVEQMKFMGMKEDAGYMQRTMYKQWLKFHKKKGGGLLLAFFDTIPIAMFFLLPIFALILKVFYWRRARFAHHLVFSLYYFSFLFVVAGLLIAINEWIFDIPDALDFLIFLSTFVYLWLSMKNFYQQGYFVTFIKAGFSTFIYMALVVPTAMAFMFISSILFY